MPQAASLQEVWGFPHLACCSVLPFANLQPAHICQPICNAILLDGSRWICRKQAMPALTLLMCSGLLPQRGLELVLQCLLHMPQLFPECRVLRSTFCSIQGKPDLGHG